MRCAVSWENHGFGCVQIYFSVQVHSSWVWHRTQGRVKVRAVGSGREVLALMLRQLVRKSLHFLSLFPSLALFLPLLVLCFFFISTPRQRLKASVQLYSMQVARPFHDLSALPCLVSQFLLLHSTLVSREFLFLFLIAEHVKGVKFSITTINHYQKLTRTPSRTESTYLENYLCWL